jgi:putative endonuclease
LGGKLHSRALLGRWGEDEAARYWHLQGAEILARNWRCRRGELDILVIDKGELVACEVKTRKSQVAGTPLESVTPEKFRRLVALFALWRSENPAIARGRLWRIDVIGVTVWQDRTEIDHLRRLGF